MNTSTTNRRATCHCLCGTSRAHAQQPTIRAQRAAEAAREVGVDLASVSLREIAGELREDLAVLEDGGYCRRCGWPRTGRRNIGVGEWAT